MWEDGRLLATPGDIIIDCIILASIVAVFASQALIMFRTASSDGISPFYLLFSNFFSSTHFAQTLLHCAFSYPSNSYHLLPEIYAGRLSGMKAFGGLLGLFQVFTYFCGCILMCVSSSRLAQGLFDLRLTGLQSPHGLLVHGRVRQQHKRFSTTLEPPARPENTLGPGFHLLCHVRITISRLGGRSGITQYWGRILQSLDDRVSNLVPAIFPHRAICAADLRDRTPRW